MIRIKYMRTSWSFYNSTSPFQERTGKNSCANQATWGSHISFDTKKKVDNIIPLQYVKHVFNENDSFHQQWHTRRLRLHLYQNIVESSGHARFICTGGFRRNVAFMYDHDHMMHDERWRRDVYFCMNARSIKSSDVLDITVNDGQRTRFSYSIQIAVQTSHRKSVQFLITVHRFHLLWVSTSPIFFI